MSMYMQCMGILILTVYRRDIFTEFNKVHWRGHCNPLYWTCSSRYCFRYGKAFAAKGKLWRLIERLNIAVAISTLKTLANDSGDSDRAWVVLSFLKTGLLTEKLVSDNACPASSCIKVSLRFARNLFTLYWMNACRPSITFLIVCTVIHLTSMGMLLT